MKNEYNENNDRNRKVELAFPKYEQEVGDNGEYISKGGKGEGLVKHLPASIDDITEIHMIIKRR